MPAPSEPRRRTKTTVVKTLREPKGTLNLVPRAVSPGRERGALERAAALWLVADGGQHLNATRGRKLSDSPGQWLNVKGTRLLAKIEEADCLYQVGIWFPCLPERGRELDTLHTRCGPHMAEIARLTPAHHKRRLVPVSDALVTALTARGGLLPPLVQLQASCSCQESPNANDRWLCSHAWAALHLLVRRLDERPSLLFELRGQSVAAFSKAMLQSLYAKQAPLVALLDSPRAGQPAASIKATPASAAPANRLLLSRDELSLLFGVRLTSV
jgi:hypothetical protein